MRIVAIGGQPGVGKSTFVQRLTAQWSALARKRYGLLDFVEYDPPVSVLGVYPPGQVFGGTDRLSMAVQPDAQRYVTASADALDEVRVLFEGDRLFNTSFLDHCRAVSDLTVVELFASMEVLAFRRVSRSTAVGATQDAQWLAGRATKVTNVLRWAEAYRVDRRRFAVNTDAEMNEAVLAVQRVLGV